MIIRPKITQGIIEDVYVCHKNLRKMFRSQKRFLDKKCFSLFFEVEKL